MKKVLANLSIRQRISIAAVALLVGFGVYELVRRQREADFKPLFTGVSAEDAAAIVQKLKEGGIEYRVPESGGGVVGSFGGVARGRSESLPVGRCAQRAAGVGLFRNNH